MMPISVTFDGLPRTNGFTIIELLLALSISGFLLTVVYNTLRTTQLVSENTTARLDNTQQWRYFQSLVRNDLKNVINQASGFNGSPESFTFHRYAITPAQGPAELRYHLDDNVIWRDAKNSSTEIAQQAMGDIDAWNCSYLHNGSWQSSFAHEGSVVPKALNCTVTRSGFERQLLVTLEIQVPPNE